MPIGEISITNTGVVTHPGICFGWYRYLEGQKDYEGTDKRKIRKDFFHG